jgi:hypothetical protein
MAHGSQPCPAFNPSAAPAETQEKQEMIEHALPFATRWLASNSRAAAPSQGASLLPLAS